MKYSFKQYQPLNLRIWHWLNALIIFGLVGTVVLRKTFLSWRVNSEIIQSKSGNAITADIAETIAKSIRDPMWTWHYYLGFVLGALLLYRIVIAMTSKEEGLRRQITESVKEIPQLSGPDKLAAVHYTIVKTIYALFYIATLYMVLSGVILYFEDALHLSETVEDVLEELHEATSWFFYIFIVGHLAGVVLAEIRKDKGIVSDMINGGK